MIKLFIFKGQTGLA